jgi:hypothetical protein
MEWEIPELEELNKELGQDDEESPYYTGYGACTNGYVAGPPCITGLNPLDPTL